MAVNFINDKISPAIICLVFLAIACAIQLPLNLNHDAAWHFQTAFRSLAGNEIGVDVFDINPPMSMWIFSLPASLVNLTGWTPKTVFKLFFIAVAMLVMLGSGRLFRRTGASAAQVSFFTAVLGLTVFILPGYDFAQREQFTALFTLPYVIAAAARAKAIHIPLSAAIATGFLAAIGIGIKPYFLCMPVLLEVWLMLSRKNMRILVRPETLTIWATLFTYLGAVHIFAPGYFQYVLPDALNNYSGFSAPLSVVLLRMAEGFLAYIVIISLTTYIFKNVINDKVFQGFLVAAAGFFLAALLQRKGWGYQLYPAIFYMLVASGFSLFRPHLTARIALSETGIKLARIGLIAGMGFMIMTPSLQLLSDGYSTRGTSARVAGLEAVISKQAALNPNVPPRVFAFITSPRDIHPAVLNSGAEWAHNAGALVYLPAAVNAMSADPKPVAYSEIMQTAKEHDKVMIDGFAKAPPDIMFVHASPYKLGITDPKFDYIDYYSEDVVFQQVFAQYTEQDPVMPYRVFVRSR